MAKLNPDHLKLSREYLFPEIEKRVAKFREENPEARILNLGIGDVALPLTKTVSAAVKHAADEMCERPFGYGPAEGHPFLRERIVETELKNTSISADEIFISEGINSDICAIQEMFSQDIHVGIIDPAYPVYYDTQVMRGSKHIHKIPCLEENGFVPEPPKFHLDLIFLCSPNNPTGIAIPNDTMKRWVDYAKKNRAIILLDAAYECFINEPTLHRSIYEVEGAEEVAIEFRSFSKSSGFTALRVGYVVVPKAVQVYHDSKPYSLWQYWLKNQNTKTNGTSYPMQRAAEAALCPEGLLESRKQISHYLNCAHELRTLLKNAGHTCYGGLNSPYIWWKNPHSDDWEYFQHLLEKHNIISIPGAGFGEYGKGFIRLSSFLSQKDFVEVKKRLTGLTDEKI